MRADTASPAAAGHGVLALIARLISASSSPHVDEDRRRIGRDVRLEVDRPGKRGTHEGKESRQPLLREHGLRRERLPAGQGEQLPREPRAGDHGAVHRGDLALGLARQARAQQMQVGCDDHEQVVEVMRHATRELPDGFELLRLCEGELASLAARRLPFQPLHDVELFARAAQRVRGQSRQRTGERNDERASSATRRAQAASTSLAVKAVITYTG